MEHKEIIARIGYIRSQANLSARELSLRIGKSPQYISKLEGGEFRINTDAIHEILTVCNCSEEKFYYESIKEYETDKELLSLIKSLSRDRKEHLIAFLKSRN